VPVVIEQPGTTVALTLKDCDVTAPAMGANISPTASAKKGCRDPSALLRRRKNAFMAEASRLR